MSLPARLVHIGHVEARGFVVDPHWCGEAEARRRILARWEPGVAVFRCGGRLVLLLPQPIRVRREAAPGEPLVAVDEGLSALPWEGPLEQGWLVARGGEAVELGERTPVDPASWLDLGSVPEVPVRTLGAPPAEAPDAAPPVSTLRQALGAAIPEADPRATELVRALQDGQPSPVRSGGSGRSGSWWRSWSRRRGAGSAGSAGGGARRSSWRRLLGSWFGPRQSGVAPPNLWARLRQRWSSALLRSQLARWLLDRHARYLAELIEAFERGDTDDALRRAIPLGRGRSGGSGEVALGLPSRREELRPRFGPAGSGGGSLPVGGGLYERLQGLYRSALTRLERSGRHAEAAFVLADLLDEPEAAVSYLERHGELEMAARLAEARELAPGLVVRQWFVAGDAERALLVARRHGAFADAVERLRDKPDKADALRVLWARVLAAEADYAAAVRAIWPVASARRSALVWLDLGIDGGGPGGAQLLVWKALWVPTRWRQTAERAAALLDDDSPGERATRLALAEELDRRWDEALPAGAAARRAALAVAATRALVRDRAATTGNPHDAVVARLAHLADDPMLAADLPRARLHAPRLTDVSEPVAITLPTGDRGLQPICDAVALPNGQTLLALGESGVLLLGRDGRVRHRFDEPATRLAVSDSGGKAIALADRDPLGGVVRLARLDLHRRSSRHWTDMRLDRAASTWSGSWFVTTGSEVLALDPLAEEPRALWRLDAQGPILALSREPQRLVVGAHEPEGFVLSSVELPSLTLRSRRSYPWPTDPGRTPAGGTPLLGLTVDGQPRLVLDWSHAGPLPPVTRVHHWKDGVEQRTLEWATPAGELQAVTGDDTHTVTRWRAATGATVLVHSRRSLTLLLRIELAGCAAAHARVDGELLVVCDDLGRALGVDLVSGAVRWQRRS